MDKRSELLRILEDGCPDAPAAFEFERQLRAVEARYESWRQSFPAYAALLDDDVQRAQALAGNWATQGRAIAQAWARLQIAARNGCIDAVAAATHGARIDAFLDAWRGHVRSQGQEPDWSHAARRRFEDVLDHLVERARRDTVAILQDAATRRPRGRSTLRLLVRPFAMMAAALRRFFFPQA